MEYYIALARQQYERFLDFVQRHPEEGLMQCRAAFFGQVYEIQISHSIAKGIHAYTDSTGKPVK